MTTPWPMQKDTQPYKLGNMGQLLAKVQFLENVLLNIFIIKTQVIGKILTI